jgi:hypothetical protein
MSYSDPANDANLQSNESKSLKCLLHAALVHKRRRAKCATAVFVVLRREDEGSEPEVREDPGERSKVSFVRFHGGERESGKVEEGVDGGLVVWC